MTRLDLELLARGLARSRGHARDLIDHGVVAVGGTLARRAAQQVGPHDEIVLHLSPEDPEGSLVLDASWVSRAAGKLLGALRDLPDGGPVISGVRAADIGACTGGFTQALLRNGAREVLAVDVGHDQLAAELRADPRVTDLSGVNARDLTPEILGGTVDLVVADLSFISLTLVMSRLARVVRPGADLLLLVKPQFEVGRAGLDGRGVVRDGPWRRDALRAVLRAALDAGLLVRSMTASRVPGQDGNTEYVVWLTSPASLDRTPDTVEVGQSWDSVSDLIDAVTTLPPRPRREDDTDAGA